LTGLEEWKKKNVTEKGKKTSDGRAEVVSVPNSEKQCVGGSYITQQHNLFVIEGAAGNLGRADRNPTAFGRRKLGFDALFPPGGGNVTCRACQVTPSLCAGTTGCRLNVYYPPSTVPIPSFADLQNNGKLAIVVPLGDGTVAAFAHGGSRLWSFNYAADLGIDNQAFAIESSEATIADLNKDGVPEVLFHTYGVPTSTLSQPMSSRNSQNLYILDNNGVKLFVIPFNTVALQGAGTGNGNGDGAAGPPSIGDLNNDGQLEIVSHTFDGRIIVHTVPGSASNCIPWPTGRGGNMRTGQPDANL
jgi:hypothetical protein